MAFLYADPIIKQSANLNKMCETYMPLDLDKEYKYINNTICDLRKTFSIKKIAVNSRALLNTLKENPKIIHISCHGGIAKQTDEFYLGFEKEGTGEEHNFTEKFLKE